MTTQRGVEFAQIINRKPHRQLQAPLDHFPNADRREGAETAKGSVLHSLKKRKAQQSTPAPNSAPHAKKTRRRRFLHDRNIGIPSIPSGASRSPLLDHHFSITTSRSPLLNHHFSITTSRSPLVDHHLSITASRSPLLDHHKTCVGNENQFKYETALATIHKTLVPVYQWCARRHLTKRSRISHRPRPPPPSA